MIKLDLDSIASRLNFAKTHYEIWEALQEVRLSDEELQVMNAYSDFFSLTIEAHFKCFISEFYRLLENRSDTVNIPMVIKALEKNSSSHNHIVLSELFEGLQETWSKFATIRHKSVAHYDARVSQQMIFRDASLSPEEIDTYLIGVTKLCEIIYELHLGAPMKIFYVTDAKKTVNEVFKNLKNKVN